LFFDHQSTSSEPVEVVLKVGVKQKLRWSFFPCRDVYPSETASEIRKNVGQGLIGGWAFQTI